MIDFIATFFAGGRLCPTRYINVYIIYGRVHLLCVQVFNKVGCSTWASTVARDLYILPSRTYILYLDIRYTIISTLYQHICPRGDVCLIIDLKVKCLHSTRKGRRHHGSQSCCFFLSFLCKESSLMDVYRSNI